MKKKFLITASVVFALVFVNTAASAQKPNKSTDVNSVYTNNDETTLDFSNEGHQYKVKITGKKVTSMYRDDNKIATEDFGKYDSLIQDVLADVEKQREEADKMRAEADVHRKEADKMRAQADVQRNQAEKMRGDAEVSRTQAEKQRAEAYGHRKQAEVFRADAEKQRTEANKQRKEAEVQRQKAGEFRAQAEIQRGEANKQREIAEKDRQLMESMLDEIVSEKIVGNRDDLKLILLDANEFTVNGVKQSDKVHKQFKGKYLKGKRIKYEVSERFRGISVE